MDPTTFDALARAFSAVSNRREVLRLAAAPLAGVLAVGAGETVAERPLDRLRQRARRHQQRQGNNGNKNNRKDNGKSKAKSRTQDCPNGQIQCWTQSNDGCKQLLVGQLGTVGRCGKPFGCCPCDHPDYGYWENLCNQTFPGGCAGCRDCTGRCMAIDTGAFTCPGFPTC
jgi:hypothetical protein